MNTIQHISVTTQIAESIKNSILDGQFPAGSKLPTEAKLCELLGVSRSSVREAIRELQAQGYIALQAGKGAFVCDNQKHDYETVRKWFIESAPRLEDFSEIREALETLSVRLAAQRGTNGELEELYHIHLDFIAAAQENDIAKMADADERFHAQIVTMAHNSLLKKLNMLLSAELKRYRFMAISVKKTSENTIREHERIYDSLKIREQRVAVSAMLEHLAMSAAEMKQILESPDGENGNQTN